MVKQLSGAIQQSIKLQTAVVFFSVWVLLNVVYFISASNNYSGFIKDAKQQVINRISLDLPIIPTEKHWLNEPGDEQAVKEYISRLNQSISEKQWPIQILSISTNVAEGEPSRFAILRTAEQELFLHYQYLPAPFYQFISVFPTFLAIAFTWLIIFRNHFKIQLTSNELTISESPLVLTIDLRSKLLINAKSEKEVALSNKPLCFYCAMLDFGQTNPELSLNMNKDLPEEFLQLAQKYFYRLIELGHTIRKRPNFENNLDKTLSEIRAALEEVLEQDVVSKEKLIPPKAIGEGSRSKVHSFNLINLDAEMFEVLGK